MKPLKSRPNTRHDRLTTCDSRSRMRANNRCTKFVFIHQWAMDFIKPVPHDFKSETLPPLRQYSEHIGYHSEVPLGPLNLRNLESLILQETTRRTGSGVSGLHKNLSRNCGRTPCLPVVLLVEKIQCRPQRRTYTMQPRSHTSINYRTFTEIMNRDVISSDMSSIPADIPHRESLRCPIFRKNCPKTPGHTDLVYPEISMQLTVPDRVGGV